MADKLGTYITKLMTTVIDKEQEEFVKELAWRELNRLGNNIGEFLHNNNIIDTEADVSKETEEKQLLQEDKENVKNK